MTLPLNLFLTIVGGCAIGGYLVRVLFPGNIILAGELFGGLATLWLLSSHELQPKQRGEHGRSG